MQHFHSIIFQDLEWLNWNSITSTSFVRSDAFYPAVTRAPPPAFPRNPRGRLGFPGPTQGEGCHDPDNHDGVITHLEPDILECEVKWALEESLRTKLVEVMEFQLSHFKS